jgi:hypothetical protein
VAKMAIINKKNLVKFGYKEDMTVRKKSEHPSVFLATYW